MSIAATVALMLTTRQMMTKMSALLLLADLWLLTPCCTGFQPLPASSSTSQQVSPEPEVQQPRSDDQEPAPAVPSTPTEYPEPYPVVFHFERKPCAYDAPPENRQEIDVNGDGAADVWVVTQDGQVYCRETDLNLDGSVDMARFLNRQGQTTREEMDLDFDGQLDTVTIFRDGQERATIFDTNHDGRGDVYRCFYSGSVVELRQDSDFDGHPDRWEWYGPQGQLIATSGDADGDGHPDQDSSTPQSAGCPEPGF